MTYAEAVTRLMEASGWKRADVEAKATDAAWAACERVYEYRNVIDAEKQARRNGLR